jgi:hypothetical protein
MPRVSFPVGWSSLRTTETSAPRATSLRFRPSIRLAPLTAPSRTSFGLNVTTIMAGGLAKSNALQLGRSIRFDAKVAGLHPAPTGLTLTSGIRSIWLIHLARSQIRAAMSAYCNSFGHARTGQGTAKRILRSCTAFLFVLATRNIEHCSNLGSPSLTRATRWDGVARDVKSRGPKPQVRVSFCVKVTRSSPAKLRESHSG